MKEYIVHGTTPQNLIKILQDGYIDNKPSKKHITMLQDKPSNQIFTQLVYYDIPNQEYQIPHWFLCGIILDKSILKDYPFYATDIGGFKNKFENGMNENAIIYGDGNLTKMPNLTKLKNKINKKMEENKFLGNVEFMHTHEILFNQKIPLDKYCIKIMLKGKKEEYKKNKDKEIDKIIEFSKDKNIPIKYRDYKLRGKNNKPINNFINSIESD
jgi:hypothetical protein